MGVCLKLERLLRAYIETRAKEAPSRVDSSSSEKKDGSERVTPSDRQAATAIDIDDDDDDDDNNDNDNDDDQPMPSVVSSSRARVFGSASIGPKRRRIVPIDVAPSSSSSRAASSHASPPH